jgi:hypothetical protein
VIDVSILEENDFVWKYEKEKLDKLNKLEKLDKLD